MSEQIRKSLDSLAGQINRFRERFGLSGSVLKTFAIISMLIDHTGATVVRVLAYQPYIRQNAQMAALVNRLYYIMRRFGRLAFPIFCFLLVEGFLHTRDVRKYASRLLIYALISEFPFDFALHHSERYLNKQNVYFTLLIGLLVLWLVRELRGCIPAQLMVMSAGMILARMMRTDYSYHGVFTIELLYILRFSRLFQSLGGGAYFLQYEKMPTPLSFVGTFLYNGKRGRQNKYFFYWFYPIHLMILGIIAYVLIPRLHG